MMDNRTGDLKVIELTQEEVAKRMKAQLDYQNADAALQTAQAAALQAAGEAAGIPKEHQGPVFKLGEVVEVKGARFRVQQISVSRLILKTMDQKIGEA